MASPSVYRSLVGSATMQPFSVRRPLTKPPHHGRTNGRRCWPRWGCNRAKRNVAARYLSAAPPAKLTGDFDKAIEGIRISGRFELPIEDLLSNQTQELEGAVNQERHKHLFAMCQCSKARFELV